MDIKIYLTSHLTILLRQDKTRQSIEQTSFFPICAQPAHPQLINKA